jgi:hypothetical protein
MFLGKSPQLLEKYTRLSLTRNAPLTLRAQLGNQKMIVGQFDGNCFFWEKKKDEEN